MFSKRTLLALFGLVSIAYTQATETTESTESTEPALEEETAAEPVEEEPSEPTFAVPQTCFASGKMVSARNAKSNVADDRLGPIRIKKVIKSALFTKVGSKTAIIKSPIRKN